MVAVAGRSKGCITCRRRKVRCDLGKPTCANCTRLKFTCGGYDRYPVFIRRTIEGPQRTEFLDEVKEPEQGTAQKQSATTEQSLWLATTPSQSAPCSSPAGVRMDQRMWHNYRFFNQHTVIHIADDMDTHFWHQLVPSLTQSHPSILHMSMALASVHQRWKSCRAWNHLPQTNDRDSFAIAHAREASQKLISSRNDAIRPLLEMISCLLLIAMELLQGHSFSAYLRIEEGLTILDRWQKQRGLIPAEYDNVIQDHVATIFARYECRIQQGVDTNAGTRNQVAPSQVTQADLCVAVANSLVKPR